MEKLKKICTVLALLTTGHFYSQIVVGGEEKKESPKGEVLLETPNKDLPPKMGDNSLYFLLNRSLTNRTLTPSKTVFSDTLGERAKEKGIPAVSFGAGFKSKIANHVSFGAGLSFIRNGESYLFEGMDTSFTYESTYKYFGFPLFIEFSYGETFRLSAVAGILPAMFSRYENQSTSVDRKNIEVKEKVIVKNGSPDYNSVVLSAFMSAGIDVKYSRNWTIFFRPEMRFQLNNTYGKNSPYVHKVVALGFSFGLNYLMN